MMNTRRASLTIALRLCLALAVPACVARAQGEPQPRADERPRIKTFGSSLKRLRWDEKGKAAVEVGGAKSAGEAGAGGEEEVLKVETNLVVSDVLVLDEKGRAVAGLTRDDFLFTVDGRPQEIGTFALGDSAAVARSIVLIIDYSGSQLPFIDRSIAAAKTLVDQLNPGDRMAIVTDDVELIADFTRDRAALKRILDGLLAKSRLGHGYGPGRFGRSRQYSALMATLAEMFGAEDTRPLVIFQTDGDELGALRDSGMAPPAPPPGISPERYREMMKAFESRGPQFSLADLLKRAERSRATIYTVVPGVRLVGLGPGEEPGKLRSLREQYNGAFSNLSPGFNYKVGDKEFKEMAERTRAQQLALLGLSKLTGGWAQFLEEPSQASAIYAHIFADIGRRYVIGFYPTNRERDGRRRQVKIEVKGHPEYTVWGRKSYYAPAP